MRPGGGKAKGSAFERDICKALSLWVSHGKEQDLFWRSAMSGGRATVGRRSGLNLARHAGDISATHPQGHALTDHWYLECKYYKDLKVGNFVLGKSSLLSQFWTTAYEQAVHHERSPMLIVKQNGSKIFVIVDAHEGTMYRWARVSMFAAIKEPFVHLLEFDAMTKSTFSMRVTPE